MADPIMIHVRDYWPIVAGVIGFVVAIFVVLKGKIPFMEIRLNEACAKIKALEDGRFISKDELFDKDNQFRFQTVPVCSEMREECQSQQRVFQNNFCKKLDTITFELKTIVNDADKKREETRFEITTMNKHLIELMTQMKTILARDRKEETADMVKMVVRQVLTQMDNRKGD